MIPHTWPGASPKPGRMLIAFTPAGKMHEFFIVYLARAAKGNTNMADPDLFARHDMKLLGPPIKA